MKNFYSKVGNFMSGLGFSKEDIQAFKDSGSRDFVGFLTSHGAKETMYRQNLRAIDGVGHRGIIICGGMCVITTTLPNGKKAVLIQQREKGEIGLPGGGTEVWEYKENKVAEPFILTAYREFLEEVGTDLAFELEFYEEHSSTILYPSGDLTFAPCTFYKVDLPYEVVEKYSQGGSEEGKMQLIEIGEIDSFKIFSNHLPAFEKLKTEYLSPKSL